MEQCVFERKLVLCPRLGEMSYDELIIECPDCGEFVLYCCSCSNRYRRLSKPCHHFPIVFTDGACLENGRPDARAGAGVVVGSSDDDQLSAPITDEDDPFPLRSNQRAELYAARLGLEYMAQLHAAAVTRTGRRRQDPNWIIATDSEYVVKGMTEWLPAWRVCNHPRSLF